MLDAKTNRALSRKAAAGYAKKHGFVLLDGSDVVTGYKKRRGQ
jgi:hypothetical protein